VHGIGVPEIAAQVLAAWKRAVAPT
jgi:hypothetical protein